MMLVVLDEVAGVCFSRGFDRGNYCSAYECADGLGAAIESGDSSMPDDLDLPLDRPEKRAGRRCSYMAGFILGYFSSYERHEVPLLERDAYDAALIYAHKHTFDPGFDDADDVQLARESGIFYEMAVGMLLDTHHRAQIGAEDAINRPDGEEGEE